MTWFPSCMDADEYDLWREKNRALEPRARADRPCSDCPSSFRNEALVAGRCNGHRPNADTRSSTPERRLVQWREAQARRKAGIRLRRSAGEVEALAFQVRALHSVGAGWAAIGRRLGINPTYARDLWFRKDKAA